MKQYNYYINNNLDPNKQDDGTYNYLFGKLLKIPEQSFKNSNILDAGCGAGEMSIFFLNHGSNVDGLDYIDKHSDAIKQKLKKKKIKQSKFKFIKSDFEEFKSKKKYDIVCVLGWFNVEEDRYKILRKAIKLTNKNGLIILSYPDIYGSFCEILKGTVVKKLKSFNLTDDQVLKLSKKIFLKLFKTLKNKRTYDVWFKDSLLSPFLKYKCFIDTKELINFFYKNNCNYYSSTPIIHQVNKMKWYKNVQSKEDFFKDVISQYDINKYQFLSDKNFNLKNTNIIKKTDFLYHKIVNNFLNLKKFSNMENKQFKEFLFNLKKIGIDKEFINNLKKFQFDLFNQNNLTIFLKKIKKNSLLNNWGKSYFHLVFTKS